MTARSASAIVALSLVQAACSGSTPGPASLPVVRANDNRTPAGILEGDTLRLSLVMKMARWYPEADQGEFIDAAAFAEEGKVPEIPGPLIRVPTGTTIAVTIRNELTDSTVTLRGLAPHPIPGHDSLTLAPGESRSLRFQAGAPGTYMYAGHPGWFDSTIVERETLAGAFVVDSLHAVTKDRIFVINIWGDPTDSTPSIVTPSGARPVRREIRYRNALAINGRAWPHTELIEANRGDSLHWRWVNASTRVHPMHLHGFYFRVDALGNGRADSAFAPESRWLAVTQTLRPSETMAITWAPTREGNWLFHCHLAFHVIPEVARLEQLDSMATLSHDASVHMAGLVLGVKVTGAHAEGTSPAGRQLRISVQEGQRRGRAPRAMGYVLDGPSPSRDSIQIPGPALILTRDQSTDVTVVNRLLTPTAVHWHGIELESYSDGVAGWSGAGTKVAPLIAPGDSFVARLTLPRSGTFIYHTHLGDLAQLTSGLYGPIVVLEPGKQFDPRTDHIFTIGWDGDKEPPRLLVNGDSVPADLVLDRGVRHRLRFINIGAAGIARIRLTKNDKLARWRRLAKDGADLPPALAISDSSIALVNVGETRDVEFDAAAPGTYQLTVGLIRMPKPPYVRRVIVR